MYPDFKKVTTYKDGPVQTSTGTQPVKQLRPCFVDPVNFCYCAGTACEHNPIKMENETEVLRISGNVTVPKEDIVDFKSALDHLFKEWAALGVHWSGNVVPQDDDTGMRLYRVEEVEAKDKQISIWISAYHDLAEQSKANDKLTLSLSEELAQERESKKRWVDAYIRLEKQSSGRGYDIDTLQKEKLALEKRLELAENNRWRTFIKWWKELN
jgi:hypothetical protein